MVARASKLKLVHDSSGEKGEAHSNGGKKKLKFRAYDLAEKVKSYDPNADEALINSAYVYAMKAHGTQTRHNGDTYFSHPVEVAGILTELKLDSATVATGLLHDTVEDTNSTLDEIEKLFGPDVSALVDGVTKLTRLESASEETKQAENFRKLMIAMSKDVRVLLVKLADRLHNMRTLEHHPKDASRRRIAMETLEIFAPLAGRMGIQDFRDELEDLAFATLYSEQRDTIIKRLTFLSDESDDLINRIAEQIESLLQEASIEAVVSGRQKRPFSTWRKLQNKEISFERLSDVMGFRVIVADVDDCYRALGVIHQAWKLAPGRFKDYISTPKQNGYQSIHTTVVGPERQRVEMQIRTHAMHDIAERGVAAHFFYKDETEAGDKFGGGHRSKSNPYRFLNHIGELLEQSDTPEEFLEHTKLEMFLDQVFCFTPKGDLIALPQGATVVDFAYAVHTDVGDTCVGAKVDGTQVLFDTVLKNGDTVDILRSEAQKPDPNWAKFVTTGKARSAIRRFVVAQERTEFRTLGSGMLEKAFQQEEQELNEKGLEEALKRLDLDNVDDIYVEVGRGHLTGLQVLHAVYPGYKPKSRWVRSNFMRWRSKKVDDTVIPIRGLTPGLAVHLSDCCHPIPGDRIVGISEAGKGMNVHIIDCAVLDEYQETADKWADLAWEPNASEAISTIGRIRVYLNDRIGALGGLCTRIAELEGNITNVNINHRQGKLVEVIVDIEVVDVQHLTHITATLRANPNINSVRRVRGA